MTDSPEVRLDRVPLVIGLTTLSLLMTSISAPAAEIKDLVPVVRGERIFVSFRLDQAFTEEIEHAIATGLEVSFRYNVQLKRVRGIWFDREVAARQIVTTVAYDNLTKRYSFTREIDGEIDATDVASDAETMRRFMTRFDSLGMFDVSLMEPNGEHYLRVNGVIRERNLLLLIPWDVGAGWKEAHFTYVR
ncbi:MAG TPA: DUF4390 domain-containing protein [Vicinamibacteria bacterium]|nr:DUF4390 domain-containing protein [Vicinamibacteria bacterium]